ncbi:HTH domain-containing protein [Mycoplasma anserisalpingitidis]|uniref:HTH domain-containing protein n=1 Tax=Mycoplasma anserisalpingitidis TaxID=519450 RepID=UPI0011B1A44A|nr:HTH domain-containing protein [Mycoplasma anserisalpingitidis]QDY87640.1 HTH domain-containing protein [Mycoplasma anserisalpingitidis]
MSLKNDAYDTQNDYNVTQNSQSNNEMSLKNDPCDTERKHNTKQFNTVKKLNKKEKILNLIRNNSNLTSKQLSDYFSLSLRTVKRDLKEMVEENLIEYIGSSKKGFWKIK